MSIECVQCDLGDIEALRARYRNEMACQILRDSLHRRPGWVEWHRLMVGHELAGYGAVAIGGPWTGVRALFEVYVLPGFRSGVIGLVETLINGARPNQLLAQTNDPTMALVVHQFGREIHADKLVFESGARSDLPNPGVEFVRRGDHTPAVFSHTKEPVGDWLLLVQGEVVATGGYLSHYNPPFVDIYMEVRGDMQKRGFGSYLVQEIRRVAEAGGKIACARCDLDNHASLKALSRAGMVPCAHRVNAMVK